MRSLIGCVIAAGCSIAPTPVLAASAAEASIYGCSNLPNHATLPSVEGKDGYFFRLSTDLRMYHPLTPAATGQLAELSRALAARGTTFIYLPIPTKGMAMAAKLPDEVQIYGFEPQIAQQGFQNQLEQLRSAGVLVVDALTALQADEDVRPPFFQADFHWTSDGAERVARATAAAIRSVAGYGELRHVRFETRETGSVTMVSSMRRALQPYCRESLPGAVTTGYETTEIETPADTLDIFGEASTGANVALIGTSFSASEEVHFSGFLAQYAELAVDNYAVAGGNQFGAIAAYLTSRRFAEQPPRYLVWENPIYNNLTQFGPGPMQELIAAVRNDCRKLPMQGRPDPTGGKFTASVPAAGLAPDAMLLADSGTDSGSRATLAAIRADGTSLHQTIERSDRTRGTGRFFFSIQPLWAPDLSRIEVTFEGTAPGPAQISVCTLREGPS